MQSILHCSAASALGRRVFAGTGLVVAFTFALPTTALADITTDPIMLTHVYNGSDGSVFSTREVGNTIVGFSQDATGQRAFVFAGTRTAMTISGQYYGLPKGASKQTGPLTLTLSNGGSTLVRSGGDDVGSNAWVAMLPSAFAFPKAREATFQSIAANNLNGAFKGTDGSRAYMRQYGSTVVYLAEKFSGAGATRPVYASVVIAERNGDGLSGAFYDLPHQTGYLQKGLFSGVKASGARNLQQTFHNGVPGQPPLRTVGYTADYAVDLDLFENEIYERLTPHVVGFSYAIAQNGKVLRYDGEGSRRVPTATNGLQTALPFTSNTLNEVASTSKTVTLVAVLRALRERGISVDSPVAPYLPASWSRGAGMNTVTFRQLLSHGYKPTVGNRLFKPADCGESPYRCLRDAVAEGMVGPADYDNIHYTVFRYILPFVLDTYGAGLAFAFGATEESINENLSSRFRTYVLDMLQSVGVDADFDYVFAAGENGAYRYTWGTPPTNEYYPTTLASAAAYLAAGSGGLKMTSKEFARFLSQLEKGAILTTSDLSTAKSIGFGGTGPVAGPSGVGPLWTKNGGASGAVSQLMVYPGTEVFITTNSSGKDGQPSNSTMLKQAWQASLIGPGPAD